MLMYGVCLVPIFNRERRRSFSIAAKLWSTSEGYVDCFVPPVNQEGKVFVQLLQLLYGQCSRVHRAAVQRHTQYVAFCWVTLCIKVHTLSIELLIGMHSSILALY